VTEGGSSCRKSMGRGKKGGKRSGRKSGQKKYPVHTAIRRKNRPIRGGGRGKEGRKKTQRRSWIRKVVKEPKKEESTDWHSWSAKTIR